jgi:hypothetical protein
LSINETDLKVEHVHYQDNHHEILARIQSDARCRLGIVTTMTSIMAAPIVDQLENFIGPYLPDLPKESLQKIPVLQLFTRYSVF